MLGVHISHIQVLNELVCVHNSDCYVIVERCYFRTSTFAAAAFQKLIDNDRPLVLWWFWLDDKKGIQPVSTAKAVPKNMLFGPTKPGVSLGKCADLTKITICVCVANDGFVGGLTGLA